MPRAATTKTPRRDPRATAGASATESSLRQAALDLFAEFGFHGTSMRDIATRANTSVSHLYYYFPSKALVLKAMLSAIVQDLQDSLDDALQRAADSPSARLDALVRAEVTFHCERQAEAFVGRSELRSLTAEHRAEVIVLYDRVTTVFKTTIAEGIRLKEFDCAFRLEATNAILTMCNGVSSWYRRDGRLSPQVVADRYAKLALQMVGAAPLDR